MIYKPISVDAYGFTDKSQTVVRIYTTNGGIITAKQCPTDKPLYCTRDGHFFSLTKFGLREVKPCFAVPRDPRVCHTRYPFMRQFGNRTCHMLMALTWIGPRPEGYEVDHINGDMLDWSTDNLQYVTPKENIKRAKLLRVLRSIGRDPKQMSREEHCWGYSESMSSGIQFRANGRRGKRHLMPRQKNKVINNAVSQTAQLTKEEL